MFGLHGLAKVPQNSAAGSDNWLTMQAPDTFYLLDAKPGGAQDAKCFLLEDNAVLMQRPAHYLAKDQSMSQEQADVIIDVVGVIGADISAQWVLLLG